MVQHGCDDRRQVDDDPSEAIRTNNNHPPPNNNNDLIIRPVPVCLTPGMSTGFAFINNDSHNTDNNDNGTAAPAMMRHDSIRSPAAAQNNTYLPAGILFDDDDEDDLKSDHIISTISPSRMIHNRNASSTTTTMHVMHQHDLLFSMDDAGPSVRHATDNDREEDRPPEYYDQSISRGTVIYNTQEEMTHPYCIQQQQQHQQYQHQEQLQHQQYQLQRQQQQQCEYYYPYPSKATEAHDVSFRAATNNHHHSPSQQQHQRGSSAYVGSLDTALSMIHKMRRSQRIRNTVVPAAIHAVAATGITPTIDLEVAENENKNDDDVTLKQHNRHPVTGIRLTQRTRPSQRVELAKTNMLHALAISAGDATDPRFVHALDSLMKLQQKTTPPQDTTTTHTADKNDNVWWSKQWQGVWWNLCKPNYQGCLESNATDDPMYHLGRLSFDMFGPTELVVSVQATFNIIRRVTPSEFLRVAFPKKIPKHKTNPLLLQTYNIVTAFTIETTSPSFGESSPNDQVVRPMKGIMTTRAYSIPDPSHPDRVTVWFTGGKMELSDNDECDVLPEWKRVFGDHLNHTQQHFVLSQKCKELACKLLWGASMPKKLEDDGSMSYSFESPMGGHGSTYCDILYLDDTIRIMKGNHGTLYVFSRMANSPSAGHVSL